jgi:hypothetical protein
MVGFLARSNTRGASGIAAPSVRGSVTPQCSAIAALTGASRLRRLRGKHLPGLTVATDGKLIVSSRESPEIERYLQCRDAILEVGVSRRRRLRRTLRVENLHVVFSGLRAGRQAQHQRAARGAASMAAGRSVAARPV